MAEVTDRDVNLAWPGYRALDSGTSGAVTVVVIVVSVVATVGVVVWFLVNRKHPEDSSRHEDLGNSGSQEGVGAPEFHPGVVGAEADGVGRRGESQIGPGPEPEVPAKD